MLPTKRHLFSGLALAVILVWASHRSQSLRPAQPTLTVSTTGSWQQDGGYPSELFLNAAGIRLWGSWSGADDYTGTIELGPFPAPRILHFGLSGYPNRGGNDLQVRLDGTAETMPFKDVEIGERWRVIHLELPSAWVGRPIRISGRDQAKGAGGWFGISEPLHGGRGEGGNALLESLAAWLVNGLLLGGIYLAAARWLLAHPTLAPPWIPLAAGAITAAAGYLAFWAYLGNSLLGGIVSWTLLAAGWVFNFKLHSPSDQSESAREVRTVLTLTLAIGALHLTCLHLYASSLDFYSLAANRYREAMPSDNELPHTLAARLFGNKPIKDPIDQWNPSDRPPLQTGWQLLTWPAGKILQLDRKTFSGTAAVWLQLLWVAGAYGLLRSLGVVRARATAWVAVFALSGFFIQNTVYTWPKLSAGAFALGAFALIFLPAPGARLRPTGTWSAAFAALAWLSHGGVAFSFLPLTPWLLWRILRGAGRAWLPGCALLLLLVLPWLAFQKFYDPPANRLFKWHLGGQEAIDPRGTWETIRDSYEKIGWSGAWANKVANFKFQLLGDARPLGPLDLPNTLERRQQEFFIPLHALTWWPAVALLALALTRRSVGQPVRGLVVVGGWLSATGIGWCLLMFSPSTAYVHQGSYAMMMGLFVLFSVFIEQSARGWCFALAGAQTLSLATTWLGPNHVIHGPATGLPLTILATAALIGVVVHALRQSPDEADRLPTKTAPSSIERCATRLRAWWQDPHLNIGVLLALALILFLRKPHALLVPQLWAEDGSIFLNEQEFVGAGAALLPYMGYLHTLPRMIAWLGAQGLDPAGWPAFYNGVSFAIWGAVLARLFTSRFNLPGKPWLALAFVLVPHSGEVFFNVTNLQWITAFVLFQQTVIAAPRSRGEALGDFVILLVVALTGPFVIVFLPLFVWRWWRSRQTSDVLGLAVAALGAAIQAWFIVKTGPKFEFHAAAFQLWPAVVVVMRRLVVWPLFGRELALSFSPLLIGLGGSLSLLGALAWSLRPGPRRLLHAQIIAACLFVVFAAVYRTRPDTWAGDNFEFGDRYFYIPRVLLAWLLIAEFDARSKLIALSARLAGLAILTVHLANYSLPAPPNYHWAEHCAPIRQGVPANIPTLPEGWTLEYRGRPPAR